jgi:hypothetical protein
MTRPIDIASATRRRRPPDVPTQVVQNRYALDRRKSGAKEKMAWGSAQPIEKARFGQADQRESKVFPLIVFAPFCPGFAGFC